MRRLMEQLRELAAHRRAIRINHHRAALKLKRASVRLAIQAELRLAEAEQARLARDVAAATGRVAAAQRAVTAAHARDDLLRKAAAAHGLSLPSRTASPSPSDSEFPPGSPPRSETADAGAGAGAGAARPFEERVIKSVNGMLPSAGSSLAADLVRATALQSIRNAAEKETRSGDGQVDAARMVVTMATDAGLSRNRLEEIIDKVAGEADAAESAELRAAMRQAMEDADRTATA